MTFPAEFHFLRPYWFLALIPVFLIVSMLVFQHRQSNFWRRHVDRHLLPWLLTGQRGRQSHGGLLLLALGWILGVIALAGPVWQKLPVPAMRSDSALMLVVDLSRSMDVTDVLPSRLERVKKQLLDYLSQSGERNIGLVLFAEDAYMGAPVSTDFSTMIDIIKHLDTEMVPAQGSRPEKGLERAWSLLQGSGHTIGRIVLITDGSHDQKALITAAKKGRTMQYPLSIVAVGTVRGGPVPINGGADFIRHTDGRLVSAEVDVGFLRRVVSAGGGAMIHLDEEHFHDLQSLVASGRASATGKKDSGEVKTDQWREFGLWLVYGLLPLAALGFRRGWLGAMIAVVFLQMNGLAVPNAQAFGWKDLWVKPDYVAYQLYTEHRSQEAATLFDDLQWKAASLYRAGHFDQAAKIYCAMPGARDFYHCGNALAQQGQMEAAISAYTSCLDHDVTFEDARYNRSLLQNYLREVRMLKDKNQAPDSQSGSGSPFGNSAQRVQGAGDETNGEPSQSQDGLEAQNNGMLAQQKQSGESTSREDDGASSLEQQANNEEIRSSMAIFAQGSERAGNSSIGRAQWLNMIKDQPNELLRLKFRHQAMKSDAAMEDSASPW